MGHRSVVFSLVVALVGAAAVLGGCGKEIGDACILASDCSPNGDRQCDPSSLDGYCTIPGCDYASCPDEAVCVRFFTSSFSSTMCQFGVENSGCSPDELCTLNNHCVARAAEVRYCMRKCSQDSDCREGYECRDATLMKAHGGEPLTDPTKDIDVGKVESSKFCAATPAS